MSIRLTLFPLFSAPWRLRAMSNPFASRQNPVPALPLRENRRSDLESRIYPRSSFLRQI